MNLTLTVDEDLLSRADEIARARGETLQQLLCDYLRTIVGETPPESIADELLELMERHGGRSGGQRFDREAAYERHP